MPQDAGFGRRDASKKKAICKFRCEKVKPFESDPGAADVKLSAEYDKTLPEEARFAEATPSGTLHMVVANPNLSDFFEEGASYYIEIKRAN